MYLPDTVVSRRWIVRFEGFRHRPARHCTGENVPIGVEVVAHSDCDMLVAFHRPINVTALRRVLDAYGCGQMYDVVPSRTPLHQIIQWMCEEPANGVVYVYTRVTDDWLPMP